MKNRETSEGLLRTRISSLFIQFNYGIFGGVCFLFFWGGVIFTHAPSGTYATDSPVGGMKYYKALKYMDTTLQ